MFASDATRVRRRSSAARRKPAVVLGGHASALAVTRALGRAGIPVVNVRHCERGYAAASKYVTQEVIAPDPVLEPDAYVETLEALGAECGGGLLVPAYDDALLVVSQRRDALSEHYAVGCMKWELAARCLDKEKTYAVAERAGIPVPQTFSPSSIGELRARSHEIGFPCLVKPRLSHLYSRAHGHKMAKVRDRAELQRAWTEARDAGLDVLVQEFIPGPDHNGANYNVYIADGEVWAECTAHKLRSKRPEIASPRLVRSRDIPEVTELGRRVAETVGVHGFVNMEFKRDSRTGIFHLIEINARHNMSAGLAVRCGINFPLIEYEHRVHGIRRPSVAAKSGVYWINLEWELREARRLAAEGALDRALFRPYFSRHIQDVFDWRDPAPFRQFVKEMAQGSGEDSA